jgi:hypothetical protein
MSGALMGKRRSPQSIRSAYEGRLRASYGDFRSPRLHFVMATADRQPFEGVLLDLAQVCPVEDDTDLNCDVCFTYIVRADQPLVVKLSLVGPYAVILSFGSDGYGEGSLVVPAQPAGTTDEARVFSVLNSHGFILVPADHLETLVPLALAKDRTEVTLYAALFEPEGEVPWPHDGA